MENKSIVKFGLDVIGYPTNDSRFLFAKGDLKLFMNGLSSDDEELSEFIANANKIYLSDTNRKYKSKEEKLTNNIYRCSSRKKQLREV